MKRIVSLLLFIVCFSSCIGQNPPSEIRKVKMYFVTWSSHYKLPRSIENFKKYHIFSFETKSIDFETIFSDALDFEDFISKCEVDTNNNTRLLNSMVELHFKKAKVVKLFFDIKGNFFYAGVWYEKNDDFYYLLFRYFSDNIVPESNLE